MIVLMLFYKLLLFHAYIEAFSYASVLCVNALLQAFAFPLLKENGVYYITGVNALLQAFAFPLLAVAVHNGSITVLMLFYKLLLFHLGETFRFAFLFEEVLMLFYKLLLFHL